MAPNKKKSDPAPVERGHTEAAVYSRPHRTQTSTFALPGERNVKGEGGRYLKHKGKRQGELEINTKNATKKIAPKMLAAPKQSLLLLRPRSIEVGQ